MNGGDDMEAIWQNGFTEQGAQKLKESSKYDLPEFVYQFLASQGIETAEAIEELVNVGSHMERGVYDLTGIEAFIGFLNEVKTQGKHLVVLGDYDCDGVCATTLALKVLREVGIDADYYINSRFIEGFGMQVESINNLLKEFPDCQAILTVDNGIVAYDGAEYAKELGIDVFITDHHIGEEKLPDAVGIINPNQFESKTPFKDICGATVIYKALKAYLYEEDYDIRIAEKYSYLVGIATIGDVMPLRDENRYFVKKAIRHINSGHIKEMNTFMDVTEKKFIDEMDIGFLLVPMINACGRLDGKPTLAMDFFLEENEEKRAELARELKTRNEDRKNLTKKQTDLAISMIDESNVPPVIVSIHEEFHEGIVGIIAGRLKEKYHRPAIVLSEESHGFKGSARSIEEMHIKDALDEVQKRSSAMLGYGGHELAAGLTVKKEQIDVFIRTLEEYAHEILSPTDLIPKIKVDATLSERDLNFRTISILNRFRPFGQGFPQPNFCIKDVEIKAFKTMGKEDAHAKYESKEKIAFVDFNGSGRLKQVQNQSTLSFIGYPSVNEFNGQKSIQVMVHNSQVK